MRLLVRTFFGVLFRSQKASLLHSVHHGSNDDVLVRFAGLTSTTIFLRVLLSKAFLTQQQIKQVDTTGATRNPLYIAKTRESSGRIGHRISTMMLQLSRNIVFLFVVTLAACRAFSAVSLNERRNNAPFLSKNFGTAFRQPVQTSVVLYMSSELQDDERIFANDPQNQSTPPTTLQDKILKSVREYKESFKRRPPASVEDSNVLLYDVFLLINLAVSISFWVVHRMDPTWIGVAFSEGCLFSMLWIVSGLYSGAFLNSAVDGHYVNDDQNRGGPKAAGVLAFQTFINTVNLRLIFALIVSVVQHRAVGSAVGEQIMPLEIGFGMVMMSSWRILHSSYVPR